MKVYDVEISGIRFPVKGVDALDVLNRLSVYQRGDQSYECSTSGGIMTATALWLRPPVTITIKPPTPEATRG